MGRRALLILRNKRLQMAGNLDLEDLGAAITKAASLQTYMTVRFLVDRDRVAEAYQAYAYFRWVDDWLDDPSRQPSERLAFIARQKDLIAACYRREAVCGVADEERPGLVSKRGEFGDGQDQPR